MPASSSGRAARSRIVLNILRRPAPNERPISTSDGLMRSMPTWASSAITHTENRTTVVTIVSRPNPSSAIRAGTTAVSGELSKMLTHIPIREPKGRKVPIRIPRTMPMTRDNAIPIPNAWT